ncbi:MAG: hypothetical protein NUW24_11845 [Anaerolineae bacterium]|nr:hypothetical protein [Anaerolineae bacterium]MDH7475654.1 hypothetical protein [Anaerolineae bacterium]
MSINPPMRDVGELHQRDWIVIVPQGQIALLFRHSIQSTMPAIVNSLPMSQ